MKQFIILMFAVFLTFTTGVKAQQTYNLEKLLSSAIENNAKMKKAGMQQLESQFKTKEVKAKGLPQLDGAVNYSRMGIPNIQIPQSAVSKLPQDLVPLLGMLQGVDALHILTTGVTVSQLVFSKPYLEGVKQAKKAEELVAVAGEKTENEIIYNVAANYYQLRTNYENLKILDETISNLEKIHEIVRLQYENDLAKLTDVNRLKVKISNLKTQREMLKDGIDIRTRVMKIACGIPIETEMMIDTTNIPVTDPKVAQFSVEALSDFQLLEKQKELAGLQIESDKAAYYPNLAVFGQFNYSSYNTKFKFNNLSNVNTFGLKAYIPIFSSGMRKNKVEQSKLKLQQVNEDFEYAKQQLGTGYQNATNSLLSAWDNLKDQQENKALAREVYNQVKLQYNEGMASLTDLLNVESSLLEAENLYNQQLLKYRLSNLDMKKSTGKLTEIINQK